MGAFMSTETPRITLSFLALCAEAHERGQCTLIHTSALAILTDTSKAYWEALRSFGDGPQYCEALGEIWYTPEDALTWLEGHAFMPWERSYE